MAENPEKKTTQQQPDTQESTALSDKQFDQAAGGFVKSWNLNGKADTGALARDVEPTSLEFPNITFHVPEPD
jgi:hypothetical protein